MKTILRFCIFLVSLSCFAQTMTQQEKIKALLEAYFDQDREIIHVQFNKNQFLNTEHLAFSGYVFSKNNNLPAINTSNIHLIVYNEAQEVVQKQLLFATNGMFSGGIHLNDTFKTGKYIFHFQTNWMNNFKENDSFLQTIEINDIGEAFTLKSNKPNYKTAKVAFFPEGGSIIDGFSNTIGVKITDCNNQGIELQNIQVFDSKSNEVSHFNTNRLGIGILYLVADSKEKYTLKIKSDFVTLSQDLPAIKENGIVVSYNNNLPNNKLAIAVKTNEKGVASFQGKKLSLLIQQNSYSVLKEINFDNKETEQGVIIDKKYLQNGVNSLRLIDENLNELAERLIYKYGTVQTKLNLSAKSNEEDSVVLLGNSAALKGQISASILPKNTLGFKNKTSLLGTFYLNTYLENPEIDNYSYFDPENKNAKTEMDALMLVQNKSKTLWENIKSNPPIVNFKFNKGISIVGKIDGKPKPNVARSISMMAAKKNIFEKIVVDKDNNFRLDNFFVQDSTVFTLQLENEKNAALFTKVIAQISDNHTKLKLPLNFDLKKCLVEKNESDVVKISLSKPRKNSTNLEDVVVKGKKKVVLTHNKNATFNAVAHKIDEREFGTILDFIGRNGFTTGVSNGNAFIYSRRDAFAQGSPEVFMDDVFLVDINILFDLDMEVVDEVYIDRTGMSSIRQNTSGTIKIYLKQGKENKNYITKCSTLISTDSFTVPIAYKNSNFSTKDEVDFFGTLNWLPKMAIKENQNLEIKLPKMNQSEIQVQIEGFSEDGQLISEMKTIPIVP